eukprot:g3133.t1
MYSSTFIACLNEKMCKGGRILLQSAAEKLAEFISSEGRSKNVNESVFNLLMKEENITSLLNDANIQCADGYEGILCKTCANNYKFSNSLNECIYCPGGNIDEVMVFVISCFFLICFTLILAILFSLDSEKLDDNINQVAGDQLGGQLGSSEDVARDSKGGKRVRGITAQLIKRKSKKREVNVYIYSITHFERSLKF